MTDHPAGLDLAAIEGRHICERVGGGLVCVGCSDYEDRYVPWPCEAGALLTEVRRLRAVADAARELAPIWGQFTADNEHADMAFMRLIDAVAALDGDAPL